MEKSIFDELDERIEKDFNGIFSINKKFTLWQEFVAKLLVSNRLVLLAKVLSFNQGSSFEVGATEEEKKLEIRLHSHFGGEIKKSDLGALSQKDYAFLLNADNQTFGEKVELLFSFQKNI